MKNTYANRGMSFEQAIEAANTVYRMRNKAVIHKRPTPMKIVGSHAKKHICVFEKKSTVDFEGVYKGRSIQFEAKSTNVPRFTLDKLTAEQYEHLSHCHEHGAISFLMVNFEKHGRAYLMKFETLKECIKEAREAGNKSIPIKEFNDKGYYIGSPNMRVMDYLAKVDTAYFE